MNKIKGFTLVELIITLVLLGIIAAYVIPRISTQGIKDNAEAMAFISNVRFIQHKSMVEGGYFYIKLDEDENKYFLYSPDDSLIDTPDGKNPVVVESRLTYSGPIIDGKIYFNLWGQPESPKGKLITDKITVSIGSYKVIIEPYSGGVYIQ